MTAAGSNQLLYFKHPQTLIACTCKDLIQYFKNDSFLKLILTHTEISSANKINSLILLKESHKNYWNGIFSSEIKCFDVVTIN